MTRMAFPFPILIVLGLLMGGATSKFAIAQSTRQASRIPTDDANLIRSQAVQQAARLVGLPLAIRRQILMDFVLNGFAQAVRLPGFDTRLLNQDERDQARRIVDQILTPTPSPTPPTPPPGPAPAPPQPNPAPSPDPGRPNDVVIVITIFPDSPAHSHGNVPAPQPGPANVPVNPWGQTHLVITNPQWVPVLIPYTTTTQVWTWHSKHH